MTVRRLLTKRQYNRLQKLVEKAVSESADWSAGACEKFRGKKRKGCKRGVKIMEDVVLDDVIGAMGPLILPEREKELGR